MRWTVSLREIIWPDSIIFQINVSSVSVCGEVCFAFSVSCQSMSHFLFLFCISLSPHHLPFLLVVLNVVFLKILILCASCWQNVLFMLVNLNLYKRLDNFSFRSSLFNTASLWCYCKYSYTLSALIFSLHPPTCHHFIFFCMSICISLYLFLYTSLPCPLLTCKLMHCRETVGHLVSKN